MKLAIPLFGSRVSPRFDCAPAFLIVIVEQGHEIQRQVLAAVGWTPEQRVAELKALAVNAVICGGIDRWSAEVLRTAGVKVHNAVTGDADEVLALEIRSEVMT